MPQSLAKIYLHLIFSMKNRTPMLRAEVREPLHSYTATVLENLGWLT
jgi:REP element-mobilizing transposase RayT